jgi:predicted RNA-binding Zn ribbon-like protein
MVKKSNIRTIRFDGGRLCLNYINTVHDRLVEPLNDYLKSVNDLIQWSFRAKVIDSGTMKTLKQNAPGNSEKADAFFVEAISLRETLYKVFLCIARDQKIPNGNLDDFNNLISLYFPHLKIIKSGNGYSEEWHYPPDSFYLINAPILKDAYDLLLHGKQNRIRECPNCGWLFYDSSKNGSRRWCSMTTCGSNVKALSWYHKHKTTDI